MANKVVFGFTEDELLEICFSVEDRCEKLLEISGNTDEGEYREQIESSRRVCSALLKRMRPEEWDLYAGGTLHESHRSKKEKR